MIKAFGGPCRVLLRRMESSVTKDPFPRAAQETLNAIAHERGYTSSYWFTLAQCQRSLGAKLRPHETPTLITLAVQAVIPFPTLPKELRETITDQHPAYFAGGVGILSHRYKWNAVLAKRLVQQLNPNDEDRAFYVDVEFAQETLGITPNPKDVIDIRAQSSVWLYNGDQLTDPFKAAPANGIALNALTGRRLGQPGHDILLAAGILRGYTSPYWVAESQIIKLRSTALTKEGSLAGVAVPTLSGTVVSLASLPDKQLRDKLRLELFAAFHLWGRHFEGDIPQRLVDLIMRLPSSSSKNSPTTTSDNTHTATAIVPTSSPPSHHQGGQLADAPSISMTTTSSSSDVVVASGLAELEGMVERCLERHPAWLLFGSNGWEATRSEILVRAMIQLQQANERSGGNNMATMTLSPHTTASQQQLITAIEKYTYVNLEEVALRYPQYETSVQDRLASTTGPATAGTSSFFRLDDVTRRVYFNAAAFDHPHYIAPLTRTIAIVDGKLAGKRAESALRMHALRRQFSSPVWVSARGAKLLGVGIVNGASGFTIPQGGDTAVGSNAFYNIDDVEDRDALLKLHPIDAKYLMKDKGNTKHMMLVNGSWRPVFGIRRKKLLSSHKRKLALWVSTNEVIMSGVSIKAGCLAPYRAFTSSRSKDASSKRSKASNNGEENDGDDDGEEEEECGRTLYNSEETTDPVRVIGLTAFYARPQVTRSAA
ncbi:Hypothetical protein, putative [Bodo saltans]|uniref:Trypanosoma Tc-38 (p38) protein domain-containing protein n=1 Tax=Bodo saltans TaxID=75058 RepID=A0A0S4JNL9_BODSA|nr:Hypothetical protein, putative [Bodo saltans]|eukprot:CUG90103.1 Hypothetical protein, putative [Bodo saltans]